MSDTPRVDAELEKPKVKLINGAYHYTEPWSGLVSADFARQLERDLAAANAELELLKSAVEKVLRAERQWSYSQPMVEALRELESLMDEKLRGALSALAVAATLEQREKRAEEWDRERAYLMGKLAQYSNEAITAMRDLAAANARAEKNEKDAERYLFLAECDLFGIHYEYGQKQRWLDSRAELDAAIDAAIAASKEGAK